MAKNRNRQNDPTSSESTSATDVSPEIADVVGNVATPSPENELTADDAANTIVQTVGTLTAVADGKAVAVVSVNQLQAKYDDLAKKCSRFIGSKDCDAFRKLRLLKLEASEALIAAQRAIAAQDKAAKRAVEASLKTSTKSAEGVPPVESEAVQGLRKTYDELAAQCKTAGPNDLPALRAKKLAASTALFAAIEQEKKAARPVKEVEPTQAESAV